MSLSQFPRNQSGFTLIELMVVMAIIAILATAGLSAYTGYIKKARDATRIADLAAINAIVLGEMSSTGIPPQTGLKVINAIADTNNGLLIIDPLSNSRGLTTKTLCLDATGGSTLQVCTYTYRLCDNGLGYAIGTRFESKSNISLYLDDSMTATTATSFTDAIQYEVGSCQTYDSDPRNLSCIMGNPCTTGGVISLTII